ncbi:MAG: PKD domain-containing protein [Deltaproteobacteria bacterium]|nr:PKD domain-containing protein [Deltaproteobacteria bacterium]
MTHWISSRLYMPITFVLLLLSSASCIDEEPQPEPDNLPPIAQAWIPQIWHLQEEVPVDASVSFDPDGRITSIIATFGDGNEEIERQDGIFAHLFPSPGSFAIRIDVTDDDGAVSTLSGQVVVVERLDDPVCSCELPCFSGGICAQGVCFEGKTSDSDELLLRSDELVCDHEELDAGTPPLDAGIGALLDAG